MKRHSQLKKENGLTVRKSILLTIANLCLQLDHLDTRRANSKYYNPQHFDPATLDYQHDVRLNSRDEVPTDCNIEDVAEGVYSQLFMSELIWPPMFFSIWAAYEPDVSS